MYIFNNFAFEDLAKPRERFTPSSSFELSRYISRYAFNTRTCARMSNANMCKRPRLGRICERCGYNVLNAIQHRSLHPVHRYNSITPARECNRTPGPSPMFVK
ncbi:hypothetical protein PUN28_005543 [Cardiocondyla obscurior]|uniref:C2H2-type domain-containing protein n=1 Tax=Cardiocondyla obscurior TaxID=286306 RepID=A0AAW2GKD8_9HYME